MLRCLKRKPGEGTLACLLGEYCEGLGSSFDYALHVLSFCFLIKTTGLTLLLLFVFCKIIVQDPFLFFLRVCAFGWTVRDTYQRTIVLAL